MIRINLYPEQRLKRLQEKAELQKQVGIAIGSIVAVVLVCVIISFVQGREFGAAEAEKAQKTAHLEELKTEIGVVDNFEKKKKALEVKRDGITQLRDNQEGPVVIMDHISRSMITAQVWLTNLSVNGTSVRISGMALTNEDIVNFQTALQSMPSFSAADLIVSRKEGSAELPLYKFELSVEG